jgi:hypothetical protein
MLLFLLHSTCHMCLSSLWPGSGFGQTSSSTSVPFRVP